MIITAKENIVLKRKDKSIEYEDVKIAEQRKTILLAIQHAMETRIRKDNISMYEHTPSREIKRWFELRRI